MPFTLSHVAAVVPIAKGRLVFSALVVGSMSPDFSYFVFQTTAFRFSHTPLGIPLFCVPISLAVLWLFHSLLKCPLISLLPATHQKRLLSVARGFRFGPLPRFGVIVVSIVLGAITHLVWDAFTHEGEWGTMYLAFLRRPIWETGAPDPLKFCDVLQHASTMLGMVFLVLWCRRWIHQQTATEPHSTGSSTAGSTAGSTSDSTSSAGRTSAADNNDQLPIQLSDKGRKQLLWTFAVITLVLAVAFNPNTKLLLHSYNSLQAFLRLTVLLAVPLLLAQLCLYSVFWNLLASRQFSYGGPSMARAATDAQTRLSQKGRGAKSETQRSLGEYAMHFAGDMQNPTIETQRLIKEPRSSAEQRSSGEY